VVSGYKGHLIRKFFENGKTDFTISYVHNKDYDTTNNIYSLFLAKDVIASDFLLMESDIIFDSHLIGELIYPDRIL